MTPTEKQFFRRVGKRLKKRRMELGLSQEWLAERIDISRAALSLIENAKRSLSLFEARDLCAILYLELDFLCYGDEP